MTRVARRIFMDRDREALWGFISKGTPLYRRWPDGDPGECEICGQETMVWSYVNNVKRAEEEDANDRGELLLQMLGASDGSLWDVLLRDTETYHMDVCKKCSYKLIRRPSR